MYKYIYVYIYIYVRHFYHRLLMQCKHSKHKCDFSIYNAESRRGLLGYVSVPLSPIAPSQSFRTKA